MYQHGKKQYPQTSSGCLLVTIMSVIGLFYSVNSYARGWEIYKDRGFEKVDVILEIKDASGGMIVSAMRVIGSTPELISGVKQIVFKGKVNSQAEKQVISETRIENKPSPYINNNSQQIYGGPLSFTGKGTTATQVFKLGKGMRKISYACQGYEDLGFIQMGVGNFIVHLYSSSGEKDYLVNELNLMGTEISGSKIFTVENTGTYAINIETSGWWSITIE